MQYTQDYDETYPMYMYRGANVLVGAQNPPTVPAGKYYMSDCCDEGHYKTWMDFTFPYTKSLNVYDCPSRVVPWHEPAPDTGVYPFASLAMNGIIGGNWTGNKASKLADMNGVSGKILMTHNAYWAYAYINPSDFTNLSVAAANPSSEYERQKLQGMFPHNDGQVFLFADGHAKFAPRSSYKKWTCQDQNPAPSMEVYQNDLTVGCGYWMPKVEPPTS